MVTHNLGVVREFAEYVYVMYAGTIVEHGPVDELLKSPRHPYTAALLAAVPRLDGHSLPRPIAGTVPNFLSPPPGCRSGHAARMRALPVTLRHRCSRLPRGTKWLV